jgi:hypothetical protein
MAVVFMERAEHCSRNARGRQRGFCVGRTATKAYRKIAGVLAARSGGFMFRFDKLRGFGKFKCRFKSPAAA